MAKEFALHQGVGDRTAIDRHERAAAPAAAAMDRSGDQFLAGARLAGDQHVDGAGRHSVDDRVNLLHRRAFAQELAEGVGPFDGPAEHLLGSQPPRAAEQPGERIFQVGLGAGEVEVVAGAGLEAGAGRGHRWLRVEHDDR